ncbi:hypothetical protein [Nocardiopsis dassonvillei]|uniref:hypothetical protein n=1 Tax=Nocardiopsis dassonvillei TaxID=2014 RepID=UPI00157C0CEE|nr:hypothetical protein [Nocardiopsis dassonvillei]
MTASLGQSGRVMAAIDKADSTLPPDIERFAADSDLAELKRVTSVLTRRIFDRQMSEDPKAIVSAIIKAKNGK